MQIKNSKIKLTVKSVGKIKLNKPTYYGGSCYGTRGFNNDYCSDCKKCYIEDVYRGK